MKKKTSPQNRRRLEISDKIVLFICLGLIYFCDKKNCEMATDNYQYLNMTPHRMENRIFSLRFEYALIIES